MNVGMDPMEEQRMHAILFAHTALWARKTIDSRWFRDGHHRYHEGFDSGRIGIHCKPPGSHT